MNKYYFIIITCCIQNTLFPAIGCMDNSYHLAQQNDSKDYKYVTCNCPCEKRYKIIGHKSMCSKCNHYRDPRYSAMLIEHEPTSCCPNAFSTFACARHTQCANSSK